MCKPLSEFYARNVGNLYKTCKACKDKQSKDWSSRNKIRHKKMLRDWYLRKTYGLTCAQFELLIKEQNGVCAICGVSYPGVKGWHLDHNHETGDVRALLCSGCNIGLGGFRDSVANLRLAAEYLEKFRNKQVRNRQESQI